MNKVLSVFFFCLFIPFGHSQTLAVLKYNGGGDWYSNPTALGNLSSFCNKALQTQLTTQAATVSLSDDQLFAYPFIHMTGHGNVVFSPEELDRLRTYLDAGGFVHIDDNYGMDEFIRPILMSLFPDSPLEAVPNGHPIFNLAFEMSNGLPKIHEHNAEKPQAFAIRRNGRIVLFYSFESDLGDGWEDAEVHNDSEEVRTLALKMGANLVAYAFSSAKDEI
jgi:hypothetical protein